MTPSSRRATITVATVLFTAAVCVSVWPSLPAQVAIHFSASGTPDNYVSKPVGVFLMPAIMLGTYAFLQTAFRFDPPDDERVATVVTGATMGLMAVVHVLVLAWNLGAAVPFDVVLVGILCWAVGLCGYALSRPLSSVRNAGSRVEQEPDAGEERQAGEPRWPAGGGGDGQFVS